MKKIKSQKVKKPKKRLSRLRSQLSSFRLINFVMLLGAGILNAVAVSLLLAPVNLYDSGISGTSMLLAQLTPRGFSISLFLLLLNTPLFLYGLKREGLCFTVYSLFAVLVYSAFTYLFSYVLPIDLTNGSPFAGSDLLLCALFGGLISGIGSGFTIRFGGAMDGIEVMAVIFAKQLSLTVGSFVMIYNVVLYLAAGCIFHSWILPLYSIIAYCVAIRAVDFIVEGLDKAKAAMIVTGRPEEISAALSSAFGLGVTQIAALGYYSGKEQTIIYFVVNRFQVARMKQLVISIDPGAFVSISEVSDLLGSSVKR